MMQLPCVRRRAECIHFFLLYSGVMTHTTALCLIPPENVWEQIQTIRSVYDKAYSRWMPHINLIYPFVPEEEFPNIQNQLESIVQAKPSFEIQFDQTSFHYFKQKGNQCTFHLRPKQSENVVEIQKIIQKCLSKVIITNTSPFEAHLTLGQVPSSRISDILVELKAKWKPITFTIDRICMISRENDPNQVFSIKNQISLVGSEYTEDKNGQYVSNEQPNQVEILPISSTKTSLCIVPPREFSSRLLHLFEDTSFRPLKPFRIILAGYDTNPHETDLRSQIESIRKFTLNFGARSICFNYSTARLFLKPTEIDSFRQLNLNKNENFDGTLTLGELDKSDVMEVCDRFTQRWTFETNEFEVDRVHLIDSDGRFQCTFPLRSQCFS